MDWVNFSLFNKTITSHFYYKNVLIFIECPVTGCHYFGESSSIMMGHFQRIHGKDPDFRNVSCFYHSCNHKKGFNSVQALYKHLKKYHPHFKSSTKIKVSNAQIVILN